MISTYTASFAGDEGRRFVPYPTYFRMLLFIEIRDFIGDSMDESKNLNAKRPHSNLPLMIINPYTNTEMLDS